MTIEENTSHLLDYNRTHPFARNPGIAAPTARVVPDLDMTGDSGVPSGESEIMMDVPDYRESAPIEEIA